MPVCMIIMHTNNSQETNLQTYKLTSILHYVRILLKILKYNSVPSVQKNALLNE